MGPDPEAVARPRADEEGLIAGHVRPDRRDLPECRAPHPGAVLDPEPVLVGRVIGRSEEHTSELQSPCNLVCRLLLEKKKNYMSYLHPRVTVKLLYRHN